MGRRGPPPQPTKLKLLRGNPGKRKLNAAEPEPELKAPDCPKWLTKVAKEEWDRVIPELLRLQVISGLDRAALAGYCQSYANWRHAQGILKRFGMTFTTDKGYVGQRPEVAIAQRERQIMRQFQQELGLTPSSRSRVSTLNKPGGKPRDNEARFFG